LQDEREAVVQEREERQRPSACSTSPSWARSRLAWSHGRGCLTVLRQASLPLGPMGAEWLAQQERDL
jgi:hypothetical protein